MPTYSYRCNDCDGLTSEHRKVDERDLPTQCSNCKSDNTKRTFETLGTHFKGTGFYKTDNK